MLLGGWFHLIRLQSDSQNGLIYEDSTHPYCASAFDFAPKHMQISHGP